MRMQMTRFAALVASVVLAGCGGGGGGSTNTLGQNPPTQFTSAQAVQAGQSVVMTGITRSHTLTGVNPTTAIAVNGADTNANVQVTAGTTGLPLSSFSAASFATAQATQSWTSADFVGCSAGVCSFSNNSSDLLIVAPQSTSNFNYQTFGAWDRDLSSATLQVGAFSAGAPTPASAVPTTGAATFAGAALGFYVDSTGALFTTGASMTANANFLTRSIAFATSGTSIVNITSGVPATNTGLDLTGTFTYSAGTNLFSGSLTTGNGALSGSGTGRFYGPAAQEIGGTYSLTAPTGVSNMVGGFGGKQ
jgi:transferrin binding protein